MAIKDKKWILQALVSAGILAVLFSTLDTAGIGATLASISLLPVLVVVAVQIPSLGVRAYRWKYLFDTPAKKIRMRDAWNLLLVGLVLNLVLPATGGDVAKSYFGFRWTGVKERMLAVSMLDKVIALGSVAAICIPFALAYGYYRYAALALLVLIPLVLLFIIPRFAGRDGGGAGGRIAAFIRRKFDIVKLMREARISPVKFSIALGLSMAGWLLTCVLYKYCFAAVGAQVPLHYIISALPIITIVRLFPLTLNGLGTDEAALVLLFSRFGGSELTQAAALSAGLLFRFLVLIVPGLAGLVVLAFIRKLEITHTDTDTKAETS